MFYGVYGCGTGSVTIREEHRLRVSENIAFRRIFGPKRVEVEIRPEKTAY
jgi:hypothetical protein